MTTKRIAGTVALAFVVSQILAIVVHGFILAADYAPFYGTLLRPRSTDASWAMLLLPLSHLCFIGALVWVSSRIQLGGSPPIQGLKLGWFGWLVGQAPLWSLWYAEQPWPGSLVVKQLSLELISSLIIGATVTTVAGKGRLKSPG